jgi:Flp pilus assembly protein TadD
VAEHAHRLAPQDASAQDTLGWLLVQQGQLDAGLKHLREARLRAPTNPEIRYHLASALAVAGRTEEARVELAALFAEDVPLDNAREARALLDRLSRR